MSTLVAALNRSELGFALEIYDSRTNTFSLHTLTAGTKLFKVLDKLLGTKVRNVRIPVEAPPLVEIVRDHHSIYMADPVNEFASWPLGIPNGFLTFIME